MTILLYDLIGSDAARPFSPHCWKVALSLAHKGLDFRTVPTPYHGIAAVENGMSKTLPVIRDGDNVVSDSFDIALYLEDAYPNGPSLFGGEGGRAMARFVERWTQLAFQPNLMACAAVDIHDRLVPEDRAYFRATREVRLGRTLEEAVAGRDERVEPIRKSLEPLRSMLSWQPFIGGAEPLYPDYIVAGAMQWIRVISPFRYLDPADPVAQWFDRCLALHGGLLARVPTAA